MQLSIKPIFFPRAATLIVTDDPIPRDMFYDGRLKMERGAVVLRLAPSWFRYFTVLVGLMLNQGFKFRVCIKTIRIIS